MSAIYNKASRWIDNATCNLTQRQWHFAIFYFMQKQEREKNGCKMNEFGVFCTINVHHNDLILLAHGI